MEYDIGQWIIERLSHNLPQFNNLPACPFAKEAWTNNRVQVRELKNNKVNLSMKEYFICELENFSYYWPKDKEVVVLGCSPEYITSEELSSAVDEANLKFLKNRGFIALEDHPSDIESVNGYILNQGTYALILLQSSKKLNNARKILEKKNYYKKWSTEYKDSVLNRS